MRHDHFPLEELASHGINICLGTDSLASVQRERGEPLALSFFAEMRRLAAREPGLSAETILSMATWNGAKALGRSPHLGHLAPGAQADLIVVPHHGPATEAAEGVINHREPVAGCMIGGRWAMRPEHGA
jgi:5-methylthioadenosine/S-adenosylhomocysteine deaminase